MGFMTESPPAKKQQQETTRPLMVMQTVSRPVVEASKQFYKDQPKVFLELAILGVLGLLTVGGSIIRPLPALWYIAYSIYVAAYFNLFRKGYEVIKKIKKKNK